MTKPTYEELLVVLKDLAFNARMAAQWVPHVSLEHAVEEAYKALARVEGISVVELIKKEEK